MDATGDGELLAMSGCEYQLGRESDGLCQPMTTCFRVSGIDGKLFDSELKMLQQKYKEYQAANKISNPRENILVFSGICDGVYHFNTTRVIKHNPVDPVEVSRAEMIARKQVGEMMRFFKENSKAFEKSAVVSMATHIGVRESRKLKGVHLLTAEEIKNCVSFEDTIALGNYEIDIHNPAGTGTELYYFKTNEFYQIPYRCMIPKGIDNLLVAGRPVCATHRAAAAVRVMPTCFAMGEAAGIAATISLEQQLSFLQVDAGQLRSRLKVAGACVEADF